MGGNTFTTANGETFTVTNRQTARHPNVFARVDVLSADGALVATVTVANEGRHSMTRHGGWLHDILTGEDFTAALAYADDFLDRTAAAVHDGAGTRPEPAPAPAGRAPAYRAKGTTDDVTTCALCGREDLRSTVVIAALDADGNELAVDYYGSDCAGKVTGWTQRQIKDHVKAAKAAEAAERQRQRDEQEAEEAAAFARWAAAKYGAAIDPRGTSLRSATFTALAALGLQPRRSPVSFLREFLADTAA